MIEVENTLITGFDKPDELKEVETMDLAVEIVRQHIDKESDKLNDLAHKIARTEEYHDQLSARIDYRVTEGRLQILEEVLEQIK